MALEHPANPEDTMGEGKGNKGAVMDNEGQERTRARRRAGLQDLNVFGLTCQLFPPPISCSAQPCIAAGLRQELKDGRPGFSVDLHSDLLHDPK